MKQLIFCTALLIVLALPTKSNGQSGVIAEDFSLTLKRLSCFGTCPEYEVTILGNGDVRYQGRYSVRVEGTQDSTIPLTEVRKLAKRLQDEHFFQWDEKKLVCPDVPAVHITATMGGQRRHVVEGCNSPGKILALADEIDRIAGTKRWVPTPR